MYKRLAIAAAVAVACAPAVAGWQDVLKKLEPVVQPQAADVSVASLTSEESVAGLKEALSAGTRYAVEQLGRDGGFLDDAAVRIAMPEPLRMVDKGLRKIHQGAVADRFIETMNRAAEQAVPEAAAIFGDAIAHLTVEDAAGILNGADDAATRYFRRTSGEKLREVMAPVVARATDQAQLTAAYKGLVKQAGPLASMLGEEQLDLDAYVTGRSLDGLFLKLAEEEKRIRENPAARTSELLQKVFGAVAK
ncbi:DUF4197 domain-containing protein [Endothiovibrio diazotrophicus]